MKANEIKVGATIWRHGYAWHVESITHDPRGNDGKTPRIVFGCRCMFARIAPGYRHIELGYLPNAEVTIDRELQPYTRNGRPRI